MPVDTHITLDEQETQVRDFLVNAAQHYAQTTGAAVPVLRFAGGWVRDKLLRGQSKDIDVAIDCMSGKQFYECLKAYSDLQPAAPAVSASASAAGDAEVKTLGRLAEIKKDADKSKHLETANTRLFGMELDLVNLRTETYNDDSRNPAMEMGTAQEDAERRDATINALFYNLNTRQVEDFTGRGLRDLDDCLIRTPLAAEQTFRDDPLRILRLIRFACRFAFTIDADALRWMSDPDIQRALERKISRERILVELQKMLRGPRPRDALQTIIDRGLYRAIFTVPGAPDGSIPEAETVGLYDVVLPGLDDVIKTLTGAQGEASAVASVLLATEEERYRAWLLAALLPYLGRELPEALVKKGAPRTMAARIARDGLKIDNEMVRVVSGADMYSIAEVLEVCEAWAAQNLGGGSVAASPGKRKADGDVGDRVAVGIAIRRWGEFWRSFAIAAFLKRIEEAGSVELVGEVLRVWEAWVKFIEREGLGDVWNSKVFRPVIDGKVISATVQEVMGPVVSGRWMSECVDVVFEYQLREKDEATPDGAKTALREAIESGKVKVQSKQKK